MMSKPTPSDLFAIIAQGDASAFKDACERLNSAPGELTWPENWPEESRKATLRAAAAAGQERMGKVWARRLGSPLCAEVWVETILDPDPQPSLLAWTESRSLAKDRAHAAARCGSIGVVERVLQSTTFTPEDVGSVRTMAALHGQWAVVNHLWSCGTDQGSAIRLAWINAPAGERKALLQKFSPPQWVYLLGVTSDDEALDLALEHVDLGQHPHEASAILERIVIGRAPEPWEKVRHLKGVKDWGGKSVAPRHE